MNFTIIEVLKENDDRIEQCRILGIYTGHTEAIEKYGQFKTLVDNKIIMVTDISLADIRSLSIREHSCDMNFP